MVLTLFVMGIIVFIIGVGVVIDGFGSIIIQGGQYHNNLFDGERYIRGLAGIVLVFFGLMIAGILQTP